MGKRVGKFSSGSWQTDQLRTDVSGGKFQVVLSGSRVHWVGGICSFSALDRYLIFPHNQGTGSMFHDGQSEVALDAGLCAYRQSLDAVGEFGHHVSTQD